METMKEYPIGTVLIFKDKEYVVMKIQPEGIRLRGTKNNPLGERFEIVVNEKEVKMAICRICYPKDNNSLYVCNHCREKVNTMKMLLQMIAYPRHAINDEIEMDIYRAAKMIQAKFTLEELEVD